MNHRIEEQELLRRIAELPREMSPRNDPWAAISERIGQSRGRRWSGWPQRSWLVRAAAASVVLALAAGLLLGPRWAEPPAAAGRGALDAASAGPDDFRVPASLAASEAEYQAAFREFITVGQARPNLSLRTLETIETSWADLRSTESALTAALAADPGNQFLNERLLELRARQLGFLQQLASLDQSNRRLTT
jgi:hypothetical protein